jgi:hypothetical protein
MRSMVQKVSESFQSPRLTELEARVCNGGEGETEGGDWTKVPDEHLDVLLINQYQLNICTEVQNVTWRCTSK